MFHFASKWLHEVRSLLIGTLDDRLLCVFLVRANKNKEQTKKQECLQHRHIPFRKGF